MPMASDSSGTHPMALELGGVLRHEVCPHAVRGVYRKPSAVLLPGFRNSAEGFGTSAHAGSCAQYVGFESEVLEQDLDPELWGRRLRERRIAELLGSQRWVSCSGRKECFLRARGGRDWQLAGEGREGGPFWRSLIPPRFQSGAPRQSGRWNLALFG